MRAIILPLTAEKFYKILQGMRAEYGVKLHTFILDNSIAHRP